MMSNSYHKTISLASVGLFPLVRRQQSTDQIFRLIEKVHEKVSHKSKDLSNSKKGGNQRKPVLRPSTLTQGDKRGVALNHSCMHFVYTIEKNGNML